VSDKSGKLAQAEGGTVFLDEVTEMSASVQAKLLHFLQSREFTPVGDTKSRQVDVRIIAATNRNLKKEVERGRFRQDLYYRLNVFPLEVAPLRERKEDIPLLASQFIERFNRLQRKAISGVSAEALSLLMAHSWPGNVREMENAIERAFIMCPDGPIGIEHLPEELTAYGVPEAASPGSRPAHDLLDIQSIRAALARNGFNRLAAAKELGMHKTTLFRKMKKLGISLPEQDGRTRRPGVQ